MRTMLLLTDFSDAAMHASKYGIHIASSLGIDRVILLHVYPSTTAVSNVPVEHGGKKELDEKYEGVLQDWKDKLMTEMPDSMPLQVYTAEGELADVIEMIGKEHAIRIVVMGMKGKSDLEKIFIGSNAIRLLSVCSVPVLLVPQKATADKIGKVMLALDLQKPIESFPLSVFDELVGSSASEVMIVNVDHTEKFLPPTREQMVKIEEAFAKFHPQYHYINDKDVAEGLNDFALSHAAGIIVTIPERHSGIMGVFRRSVTKKLAWHTEVPLLALPEVAVHSH